MIAILSSTKIKIFNQFNHIAMIILIIIGLALNCQAEDIIVSDGDTIKINNKKIRLFGIDAPESKQKCFDQNGKAWGCGIVAKEFLVNFIGSRKVRCEIKEVDLYKREVAICYAGKDELNRVMVQKGMAIAYRQYSKRYVADELKAKKEFIGIWSSAFMDPEHWRRYQKFKKK